MIYAIVGAGGKTGLLKEMAARFRQEGKTVFATTTTHMFIEEDTLLTEDADLILPVFRKNRKSRHCRQQSMRKYVRQRMWFW